MKILIMSFYFPPDLSAGSFRIQALLEALKRERPSDLHIDIITTAPNRYSSLAENAPAVQISDGLNITRLKIPSHKGGFVDQAKAFAVFARAAEAHVKHREWDAILATSSRLMTAALGARIARSIGSPLYLDIRDLFSDTIGDLYGSKLMRIALPIIKLIEKRTFRSAERINIVSPGFLDYVKSISSNHDCRLFLNGIDDEFLDFDHSGNGNNAIPVVSYAGNIGDGQGLHKIIPKVSLLFQGKAEFKIVGDGGRRRLLESIITNQGSTNVTIHPPVRREKLNRIYAESDILFLHLNDHDAFKKVIPSKLFEYAATGKKILAGVDGCAADFIRQEIPDAEVFKPCDTDGMTISLDRLLLAPPPPPRVAFRRKFARNEIMQRFAKDLLQLASTHSKRAADQQQ